MNSPGCCLFETRLESGKLHFSTDTDSLLLWRKFIDRSSQKYKNIYSPKSSRKITSLVPTRSLAYSAIMSLVSIWQEQKVLFVPVWDHLAGLSAMSLMWLFTGKKNEWDCRDQSKPVHRLLEVSYRLSLKPLWAPCARFARKYWSYQWASALY